MRIRLMFAFAALGLLGGQAAADDVKAVLEKAIEAHGGEANISKYKAAKMKAKGTISIMGAEAEFTIVAANQLPDQFREELKLTVMGQEIELVQVFDGKKGWASAQGNVMEAADEQLAQLKEQAYGSYVESLVPLLKDKQFTVKSADEVKVDGKPAAGVLVTAKGQKDMKLYFDKESGLLVKMAHKGKDPAMQEVNAETFYRDYKDFGGIKQPMKVEVQHDGKKFLQGTLTEFKPLEKLDASTFAKP